MTGTKSMSTNIEDFLFVSPEYLSAVPDKSTYSEDYLIAAASYDYLEDVIPVLKNNFISHGMAKLDAENFVSAVIELIQNAQVHGYNLKEGSVPVTAIYAGSYISFAANNPGKFNTQNISELISTSSIQHSTTGFVYSTRSGGRGFAIIKETCDSCSVLNFESTSKYFDDSSTTVVIGKVIKK